MSAILDYQTDNIYLLRVTGEFKKAELDAIQADFVENLADAGSIRLLVLLENFTGWEPNAAWDELNFFFSYGDAVEKIAIVGDPEREAELLAFAGAGFRKAPVKFFPTSLKQEAETWLAE